MAAELRGWDRLRHGGLLLDLPRLRRIAQKELAPLAPYHADVLRRMITGFAGNSDADVAPFVSFVLEVVCGFGVGNGAWQRGAQVAAAWSRRAVTGESVRPRYLWTSDNGALLPVFVSDEPRLGVGRGRRTVSQVLQWLRAGEERLAVITNGAQWRLVFAGLDFDAWCEWDVDLWLEEGEIGGQVDALRTLLSPLLWTPPSTGAVAPLLEAVLDSRKGQAELSAALGERVREAVELLVQAHSDALSEKCADVNSADVYRAAARIVMRMVVVLFAESRDLLPRDSTLYHTAYGLGGLLGELERAAARGGHRLKRQHAAWPRVLGLFRLVHEGSHHPALPVPAYGGDLFAPANPNAIDGLDRALTVFERACFDRELMTDDEALRTLERLTRTRVKVRQGRTSTWVTVPVDFSDLSSEYIGILYEGLLDFELRSAPSGDPVVFLTVGNQPALPLSRLEEMDDASLANLLEKMKDTSKADGEASDVADESAPDESVAASDGATIRDDSDAEDEGDDPTDADDVPETVASDTRHETRTRAEQWARRAVVAGGLVPRLRGAATPERRAAHETSVARKARQLVTRVVLPGERYLVRWGGTRKGSGTFYTRPGLAVPLVQRTLRPLAWDPPLGADGRPDTSAAATLWTPKTPEVILGLTVCDPACGSGTFPVGALRFLTDSLYAALHQHSRIVQQGDQALVRMLGGAPPLDSKSEQLGEERLPCRPDDPTFEARLKAVLRRHVVERCIYGVDIDPLAVELCRLALWIETMDRTLPFSFLDHKIKCGNGLVGAWFDQFQHYPVMAWKNREGGDKGHTHGVHFAQDARGKAIKEFTQNVLTPDLQRFLSGRTLFDEDMIAQASGVHDSALATLAQLHELPVQDAAERGRLYREQLLGSPAWQALKQAMDLWCACWFWPADRLADAPLPSTFASSSDATHALSSALAAQKRFFHWELEFPDVFIAPGAGFDALLGNPPWDIAKPSSKEFFSDIDPLFRAYGKQEAIERQRAYFQDEVIERRWLDYSADFRAQSNYVGHVASPFGDPAVANASDERFMISRGKANAIAHERWRQARRNCTGYSDSAHPFRHQGSADVNLYKLFLEQAHVLLGPEGRLGFIVPSGLYSDQGTGALRALFLDRCGWEWLFGFENREKLFDIHRSFKFNPVIIAKGGRTEAIRTAFMRRSFRDWELAEQLAIPYARAQVERFSPRSRSILEVESTRDLEIVEKIYANSVLLGDQSADGWGVKYTTEFHMTSDSKLFPPRPKWEADGYRPDEYSRWLKGNWRPISELWAQLGVDPERPVPAEIELEEWLFDSSTGQEERRTRAQLIHGHVLKPGDVQPTEWRVRCAQPPYDALPIPRAEIPPGFVISRNADAWIPESEIESVALPLYEGRMINMFDFTDKGWVSGKGRTADWKPVDLQSRRIEPQYLMSRDHCNNADNGVLDKIGFLAIGSATNTRSLYAAAIPDMPCGNSVGILSLPHANGRLLELLRRITSFVFDFVVRMRLTGLNLNWFVIEEAPLTISSKDDLGRQLSISLSLQSSLFAATWLAVCQSKDRVVAWRQRWALLQSETTRLRAMCDAIAFAEAGLDERQALHLLRNCDFPTTSARPENSKGFWRVDRDVAPELRATVLSLIALTDLRAAVVRSGGDRVAGIREFLTGNDGEGWLIPEAVRIADYDLGQDDRAQLPQPVASRLGPRFFDWQLMQSAEESWRECHLHARNMLGEVGYQQLLADIEAEKRREEPSRVREPAAASRTSNPQVALFD